MKIKAIITGSTGMVGEGVLHQCLLHPDVESVLVITRNPCGVKHEKIKEIIHKDFFDLSSIEEQLIGYNACYFVREFHQWVKRKKKSRRITYDLTMKSCEHIIEAKSRFNFLLCVRCWD